MRSRIRIQSPPPVNNADLVNKQYVDGLVNGLISDATPAADKAYSSSKVNTELANRYTKSEISSLYYSKQDTNDIVNEVKSATYHFIGYVASATFTDPNVKIGHLLIVASAMPVTFPATAMQWNGAAWEDAPDYTPTMFDLWSNRSDNSGYYWFAGEWNLIDQNIDLSAYRTAAAQDTVDEGIMDAIALKADKSGVLDIEPFTITGDGSATSWALTHNKNTMNVFTFIYDASTGAQIFPGVTVTSANVVTITTATPLASGYQAKVNLLYKP